MSESLPPGPPGPHAAGRLTDAEPVDPGRVGDADSAEHALDETDDEETLFAVLARQARGRAQWQLVATAAGGMANSAFFWVVVGTWWLGTAFASVAAYGAWGLLDAEVRERESEGERMTAATGTLRVARAIAAAAGGAAVLATAAGFLAAAFGGWRH